jgi:hypothetical protein
VPISPFLDDLLTQWLSRGVELRKEIDFQKELILPAALAAHGNRLALRQRRHRDLRQVEQIAQQAEVRWEERLNRIEEWGKSTAELGEQSTHLQRLIHAMVWLKKARSKHQDSFTGRMGRRAQALVPRELALREKLQAWEPLLQDRVSLLQELLQKSEPDKPLYVSRARKQPEIDFLTENQTAGEALGREMVDLRRSLTHLRERLNRAFMAVQNQAEGAAILYEVHKQEILGALKESEKNVLERRDDILSTALLHEGCRYLLRQIQNQVRALQCIEDLPKPSKHTGFKKLFQVN